MKFRLHLQRHLHNLLGANTTPRTAASPIDFTGIDFASPAPRRQSKPLYGVLIFLVLFGSALSLLVMRVEIIRLRYELATSVQHEQELLATQREQTVAVRKLRDPVRLRRLAAERGLAYPEQIIRAPRAPVSPSETAP